MADETKEVNKEEKDSQDSLGARALQVSAILRSLRAVFRAVQEYSRWVEKQCGVSATQLWLMSELAAQPGMRISEVARALSIHQSTASNLLDKLERRDLVQRRREGPDQRVVRVQLTAEGQAVLARSPRPAQGPLTDALHRMEYGALTSLHEDLDHLVALMSLKDESAGMEPIAK